MTNAKSIPKDVLDEYIVEVREMCERVSLNLGKVEKNQYDDETLNAIYRDMHSIKGSSHLFGFKRIGDLAHVLENSLDPVREKTVKIDSSLIDVIYASLDVIGKMLENIIVSGSEGTQVDEVLSILTPKIADTINKLLNNKDGGPASRPQATPASAVAEVKNSSLTSSKLEAPVTETENPKNQAIETEGSLASAKDKKDAAQAKDESSLDSNTVRINVNLLDNLMSLVGELVLIRNQVVQFDEKTANEELHRLSQRLNVVTSEIQNDVMKTRMQPVGTVMSKFHRVVRDISKSFDKRINLQLEGTETELDKTLIEAVKDPLTHLVRNSADHGIELPEERRASGKSETGCIRIRSYHEGGQVVIEISDDGRGLARSKILKKAIEKGLVSSAEAEKMSDRDVFNFIFAPGFSTAEKVSNISGRGVGMDVVKTNIEKIGGTIDLQSTEKLGTKISLKIPLTLAIIPALLVKTCDFQFAVPQIKILELVRIDQINKSNDRIESLQGNPVFRLRGKLLPLVDLKSLLRLKEFKIDEILKAPVINIVVVSTESGSFGLLVEEIVDSVDIVVKSLVNILKKIGTYSGSTILGDGSPVLILDVTGLALRSGVLSDSSSKQQSSWIKKVDQKDAKQTEISEYLEIEVTKSGKFAIPLCLVNRLEEFELKQIQIAGDNRVIMYRDSLLPLIDLPQIFAPEESENKTEHGEDKIIVVVVSRSNRLFGFIVKRIVDVLFVERSIDGSLDGDGNILGSIIHDEKVISVLDVYNLADGFVRQSQGASSQQTTEPSMLSQGVSTSVSGQKIIPESRSKFRILLIEDTTFFRKYISEYLKSQGYMVDSAINGEEAIALLDKHGVNYYQAIVSDIEMPVMNGFETVKKIRGRAELQDIPVIALTTRVRPEDVQKGMSLGFTKYLEKFNGQILVGCLDECISRTMKAS